MSPNPSRASSPAPFDPATESYGLRAITGSWRQRAWEARLFDDPVVLKFFEEADTNDGLVLAVDFYNWMGPVCGR